jgi:hypothetical protein
MKFREITLCGENVTRPLPCAGALSKSAPRSLNCWFRVSRAGGRALLLPRPEALFPPLAMDSGINPDIGPPSRGSVTVAVSRERRDFPCARVGVTVIVVSGALARSQVPCPSRESAPTGSRPADAVGRGRGLTAKPVPPGRPRPTGPSGTRRRPRRRPGARRGRRAERAGQLGTRRGQSAVRSPQSAVRSPRAADRAGRGCRRGCALAVRRVHAVTDPAPPAPGVLPQHLHTLAPA